MRGKKGKNINWEGKKEWTERKKWKGMKGSKWVWKKKRMEEKNVCNKRKE